MKKLIARVAVLTGIVVCGSLAGAQEKPDPLGRPEPGVLVFMAESQFGPEGASRVVKGQPYSAQTVTEITQTLADGNRIVQRSEGAVYRDGEGRTRREHTFTGMRPIPFEPAMHGRQFITIDDVVAGVQYALDPQDKTARQMPRWSRGRHHDDGVAVPGVPMTRLKEPGGEVGTPTPVRERLGTKPIEGLEAEGTRTTVTIAAGEIGNEAPIAIVTERWWSNELQEPVLIRFSDPRVGERVYRLTAIARGEPSPQLFVVPPDYKTVDGFERPMRRKRMP